VKRLLIALFVFAIGYGIGRSCGSTSYELISEAKANAQEQQAALEAPFGTGGIAEFCQRRFSEPTAQTACEVHYRLSIRNGVSHRLETLEEFTHITANIDFRQDVEIAKFESRLNALEAKRSGE
jgi:hypothetical protein